MIAGHKPNTNGKDIVTPDAHRPEASTRLDTDAARAYLGVDEETFSIIVQTGLKEIVMRNDMMSQALAIGDMVQTTALAHDIKSTAQTIGAMTLHLFAKELEFTAKTGDADMAVQCHDALRTELAYVQKALVAE